LWVHREDILLTLFKGRIIIPQQVLNELSSPKVPHIGKKVNDLLTNKDITVKEITLNTSEYDCYQALTNSTQKGLKIIGNGEAAVLSLAKVNGGIVASNNLKDIAIYVEKFNLNHTTTADILVQSFKSKLIDESCGNLIWQEMILKKRKLPADSFSNYCKQKKI
jgi:hypothetical protein